MVACYDMTMTLLFYATLNETTNQMKANQEKIYDNKHHQTWRAIDCSDLSVNFQFLIKFSQDSALSRVI